MTSPVRLYSNRVCSARSPSKGPPIHFIFLHGFLSHGNSLLSLARRLQRGCTLEEQCRQVEAITVDCRNHGLSPHTSSHTLDELVADINMWMEEKGYLIAENTVPPNILAVGHSMGSLAWTKFLMNQENDSRREGRVFVSGLVSLDMPPLTGSLFPSSIENELSEYMNLMKKVNLSSIRDMRSAQEEFSRCGIKDRRVRDFFTTNIRIVRANGKVESPALWKCNIPVLEKALQRRSVFLSDTTIKNSAHCKIRVPILSVLGGLSPIGGDTKYHGLWNKSAVNVKEYVLQNAGHNLYYDKLEETAQLIEDFVRGLDIQHNL
ncbi:abhydrolase domain-containing protein 11 [Trypanosoma theileri]|uniref:Abhydrolase domain-containing protein 11 n=1 Tax=Trypanosoma theileri TaxID=67003 RepID=A0A1X0NS30_9TRYP|nr:abhydrolase domain-containing protein 11 [Trypanosoma theileri]ORC87516.1 abhydrolase domain-containing protein 11 [Trypanosoma theileri]